MAERLALFPLGTVLFPGMTLPLHIFEPRYQEMVGCRVDADPMFGVVLIRSGNEVGDQPSIYETGTTASSIGMARYDDGRFILAVCGGRRFHVKSFDWDEGYMTGSIEWIDGDTPGADRSDALLELRDSVTQEFHAYLDAFERAAGVRIARSELGEDSQEVAYAICSMMPLSNSERQLLLELPSPRELLAELQTVLRRERRLLTTTGIGGATATAAVSRFSTN